RPSGEGNSKGFDSHSDAKAIEDQIKMEEELDVNETGTPDTMRHPNRNTTKARQNALPANTRKKSSRTTRTPSANTVNRPASNEVIASEMLSSISREEFQKLDQVEGNIFFS